MYLPATPQEFQDSLVTRAQLDELEKNPPEWLAELRRNGPHPRPVVAGRLNVSIAGLTRGGADGPLTTDEINELRDDPPAWLVREREIQAGVRAEEERIKERDAKEARKKARSAPEQARATKD
ncbi:hypothetical protein Slu03_16090 [Sediminihabitans luteus]|nr:hypothetical protein Slu03_16090 [Sediminihabitans luteus]